MARARVVAAEKTAIVRTHINIGQIESIENYDSVELVIIGFFFVGSKNGPESINIDKVLICEVRGSASNVATG